MELLDERRGIYGLGGGLGLSPIVGEVALGIVGNLSRSPFKIGSVIPTISSPYSSVSGRGGGLSTMASRSCEEACVRGELGERRAEYILLCVTPLLHTLLPFPQAPRGQSLS